MPTIKTAFAIAAYVIALTWADLTVVGPNFAYESMEAVWPGIVVALGALLICVTPGILLPVGLNRPSLLVIWWLYLVVYIPTIVVSSLGATYSSQLRFAVQGSLLGVILLLVVFTRFGKRLSIPARHIDPGFFWPAFITVVLACYAILIISTHGSFAGFTSLLVGRSDVYDLRDTFQQASGESPLAGYAVGLLGEALDPFLLAVGLINRRWSFIAAGLAGQIFIFSLTGMKSVLLSTLYMVLFLFLINRRKAFALHLAASLGIGVAVLTAFDLFNRSFIASSVLTRRVLLVPGLLVSLYFEYFSNTSPVYFGNGALGHLFGSRITMAPAMQVGTAYFTSTTEANASLWAEGYGQAGLLGVVGFTLFLMFLLWLYDGISERRDQRFAALMIAIPAFTLSNTSPLTMLATHAGIVVGLLVFFSPQFSAERQLK